ncbi:hypothetical protein [Lichenicoccus sp.]|uniref:hypothetical protein n=1 Tax=Lichenicoccus sp. TaxID=2781899 RepID=UPI003D0A95DE
MPDDMGRGMRGGQRRDALLQVDDDQAVVASSMVAGIMRILVQSGILDETRYQCEGGRQLLLLRRVELRADGLGQPILTGGPARRLRYLHFASPAFVPPAGSR